jgi:hypothetical protein
MIVAPGCNSQLLRQALVQQDLVRVRTGKDRRLEANRQKRSSTASNWTRLARALSSGVDAVASN